MLLKKKKNLKNKIRVKNSLKFNIFSTVYLKNKKSQINIKYLKIKILNTLKKSLKVVTPFNLKKKVQVYSKFLKVLNKKKCKNIDFKLKIFKKKKILKLLKKKKYNFFSRKHYNFGSFSHKNFSKIFFFLRKRKSINSFKKNIKKNKRLFIVNKINFFHRFFNFHLTLKKKLFNLNLNFFFLKIALNLILIILLLYN